VARCLEGLGREVTRKWARYETQRVRGDPAPEEINWGRLTAAATVITLPVLVLALIVQKHIVRGLTLGALKV
jgi:ABC-type glycerol-3-phosphate transport system permease component